MLGCQTVRRLTTHYSLLTRTHRTTQRITQNYSLLTHTRTTHYSPRTTHYLLPTTHHYSLHMRFRSTCAPSPQRITSDFNGSIKQEAHGCWPPMLRKDGTSPKALRTAKGQHQSLGISPTVEYHEDYLLMFASRL